MHGEFTVMPSSENRFVAVIVEPLSKLLHLLSFHTQLIEVDVIIK